MSNIIEIANRLKTQIDSDNTFALYLLESAMEVESVGFRPECFSLIATSQNKHDILDISVGDDCEAIRRHIGMMQEHIYHALKKLHYLNNEG